MKAPRFTSIAALATLSVACRAQVGAGAGWTHRVQPASGASQSDLAWGGSLAGELAPDPVRGPLVGAELDLRSTLTRGARVTMGLRFGYSWQTARRRDGRPGFDLVFDAGVPVREGVPFWNYSFYAGVTASWVWWLGASHEGADLNRALWYLHAVPQLVLFLRTRVHVDDPGLEPTRALQVDAALGAALRFRFLSDIL